MFPRYVHLRENWLDLIQKKKHPFAEEMYLRFSGLSKKNVNRFDLKRLSELVINKDYRYFKYNVDVIKTIY